MRKFATLAMMAISACAVDMQVEVQAENPYKDLFDNGGSGGAKGSFGASKNNGSSASVKVNVWDTVDSELDELHAEVQDLVNKVNYQGNMLKGT